MTHHSQDLQRKLELVVRTGHLLARSSDIESLVQATTDAGLALCGAQFGAFFYNIVNSEGESYLLYSLSGVDRAHFDKFPMPRNTQVFAPTFEGREIVRSGDITKDPRYAQNAPRHGMPAGHLPVCSYLAVPVKAQSGEVLGGLFYGHAEPDIFTKESEEFVSAIATQAAIAMENFRLREQLNRRVLALEISGENQRDTVRILNEFAAIVEGSDDAIISKDLQGRIRSWNGGASRIFGYSKSEMVGQSILKIIPEELHPQEDLILKRISAGIHIDHFETVRLTREGERIDVSLSISPIRDAAGNIVGAAKILRDISARKRMEGSYLEAEKIAASGRMAAAIAHEINNPLEAVINLLYLARQNMHDLVEADGYLATAEAELARVAHIARQTLGFYRENSSAVKATLSEIAAAAIKIYGPKCQASEIHVISDFQSRRAITLRRGEIMQVISNLIANAIYAMPSGGTLTLTTRDESDGASLVIADTGVGIPPDRLPRIFEAFFTTRGSVGTGIGLFIARQFIEGHSGHLCAESNVDPVSHGTRMSIFLPTVNAYTLERVE